MKTDIAKQHYLDHSIGLAIPEAKRKGAKETTLTSE